MNDTYKTLTEPTEEVLYKEKNSKFFGYGFPISSESEVKEILENIKKQHHTARHWCYAFQIGTKTKYYRANVDGEPSNTAGMPIYGQIQSFDVTNVLIVVVRYFDGIKLGVGGLITAYKETAQMVLNAASIEERTIDQHYMISFDYKNMNKVMRIIKEKNIQIVDQKMEMSCEIEIKVRLKNAQQIFDVFDNLFEINIQEKEE